MRVQPGEQARLHVGDARAVGDALVDPERALGDGPGIEDGVHVPDEQDPRTLPRPVERADHRVPEATLGIGPQVDVGTELGQERGDPAGDLVRRPRACTTRSRC